MTLRHIWKIAQRVLTALVLAAPLLPRTSGGFPLRIAGRKIFSTTIIFWEHFFEFLENDWQVHFFVNARFL